MELPEPIDWAAVDAEVLLRAILDRPNGDILNIVQAAAELPGTLHERLSKAYHEITGNDGKDEVIGLST